MLCMKTITAAVDKAKKAAAKKKAEAKKAGKQ